MSVAAKCMAVLCLISIQQHRGIDQVLKVAKQDVEMCGQEFVWI